MIFYDVVLFGQTDVEVTAGHHRAGDQDQGGQWTQKLFLYHASRIQVIHQLFFPFLLEV